VQLAYVCLLSLSAAEVGGELLLHTVEMLAVASTQDPERIQTAVDQLRKDFLGADSEI
jgi:hypothetical protein